MKLLLELYSKTSRSNFEGEIVKIVTRELDKMSIQYNIDEHNQIYRIIENTPLLCAHMDQIYTGTLKSITYSEDFIFGENCSIGADDKNGVWILLNLIKKFRDNVSFIFSTCEEIGGNVGKLLNKMTLKTLDTIKYCLIFDRMDTNHIIGKWNSYCEEDFQDDIEKVGQQFGYKPDMGVFSDADVIVDKAEIPCVNLSCGYYSHHTVNEFTVFSELQTALEFGIEILNSLTDKYDRVKYTNQWEYYFTKGTKFDPVPDDEQYSKEYYYCEKCLEYVEEEDIQDPYKEICPFCGSSPLFIVYDKTYKYSQEYTEIKNMNEYCPACDIFFEEEETDGTCPFCKSTILKEEIPF